MSLVTEHLKELGIEEDWIIQLGELIQLVIQKDPALAAGKAIDLSRQENIASSLKSFIEGWRGLMEGNIEQFTPVQRDTLSEVIGTINKQTFNKFVSK